MFGNIEEKIRKHAVDQLVERLAEDGTTHVEGIGTFKFHGTDSKYINRSVPIEFEPDMELVNAVISAQRS